MWLKKETSVMASDVIFERNPDYIFRKIMDDAVLVPLHQDVADMDCIYTLNDVGASIWGLLTQPASFSDLEEMVLAEYEADPEVLKADLVRFLEEMVNIGAVQKVTR